MMSSVKIALCHAWCNYLLYLQTDFVETREVFGDPLWCELVESVAYPSSEGVRQGAVRLRRQSRSKLFHAAAHPYLC